MPGSLTTFHTRLMEHLPAAVRDALGEDFGAASPVYDGRREANAKADQSVFVATLGRRRGAGAYRSAFVHRYRLHVLVRRPGGAKGTGKLQADLVDQHLAALGELLDSARPFQPDLPDVLSTSLEVEAQDAEPDDEGLCEGRALLLVFTRGTGDLTLTSPGG